MELDQLEVNEWKLKRNVGNVYLDVNGNVDDNFVAATGKQQQEQQQQQQQQQQHRQQEPTKFEIPHG
jgi:hypothetical protein